MIRAMLSTALTSTGYACKVATDGSDALRQLALEPFDLLLTDIWMPTMDGVSLLRRLVEGTGDPQVAGRELAVVMMTGSGDVETAVTTLRMGAYDYIHKPVDLRTLNSVIERAMERRRLRVENREYQRGLELMVEERTAELLTTYRQTLHALGSAIDTRDPATQQHTQRVVRYTVAIARQLGITGTALQDLEWGAMVHDVGKIGIPDAILRKPGPLDEAEWAIMKTHPEIGTRMLESIPFLRGTLPVVRHHHERWDGTGYPDRLQGEEIPMAARIFKVADVFDALISARPYKGALDPQTAAEVIFEGSGTQFDPVVVEAFRAVLPEWC